jgi:hypothetical protein
MGSDFTAADQAFLLIDIVVTLAVLFIWAFWQLEKAGAGFRFRPAREIGLVGAWIRKSFLQ